MPANTAQRYREFARDTQDESPASNSSPSPSPRTMSYRQDRLLNRTSNRYTLPCPPLTYDSTLRSVARLGTTHLIGTISPNRSPRPQASPRVPGTPTPAGHVGTERLVAGKLIMAGGGNGTTLDYRELERWTRVGFERGMRFRHEER